MDGVVSEIRLFAAPFAPRAWAYCAGQILSINTNVALFTLLGTTYGGDGIRTFALPDYRGRIPAGTGPAQGISQFPLGSLVGTNTVTATILNLPVHTHAATGSIALSAYADVGNTGSAENANLATLTNLYSTATPDTTLKPIPVTVAVAQTGNNLPMSIQQPFLGMNYIICLQGLFPSRN